MCQITPLLVVKFEFKNAENAIVNSVEVVLQQGGQIVHSGKVNHNGEFLHYVDAKYLNLPTNTFSLSASDVTMKYGGINEEFVTT